MNTKKISHISIVFENCEVVRIELKDFLGFAINENYKQYNMHNTNICNIIKKSDFFFMIFKDLKDMKYVGLGEKEESLFERLTRSKDITHIDIVYENLRKGKYIIPTENDYFSTAWGGNDNFYNYHQVLKKIKSCRPEDIYCLEIINKWNIKKILKLISREIQIKIWRIKNKVIKIFQ